ncbi:MAG: molecular chaperone TorD family protein [Candidatus Omnitrophica bacterium]|nr:molecular chaperone TorD family protein [Candidatus Omnitrophota bacterium]
MREAPSTDLLKFITGQEVLEASETEKVAVQYARLFLVPGDEAVRPYESVYCDALTIDTSTACSPYFPSSSHKISLNGYLGGPSSTAVREVYRQAGLDLAPASHELPDHLAIELEFMGRLLERRQTEQGKMFFHDHLARWVYDCLHQIKQKTDSGFYQSLTEKLEQFLLSEQALFST